VQITSLRSTSMIALLAYSLLSAVAHAQTAPTHKPSTSASSPLPTELTLQLHLRADPHDVQAHKQLNKLLRDKYAFRAEMEEDGRWLRDNPNDYVAEIEMRSLAETAVSDPEYAITIDRFVLAKASRQDDPAQYDNVSDRLARSLLNRGYTSEALSIMKKEVELAPEDFGVWENLGDGQVQSAQIDEGVASYRKAIALDGNQEGPHEGLADAYLKQHNYRAAATELKAALAIYNAQYHGAAPSDSYHSAMKQMQDITHMEPNLVQLHRKLARVYIAQKDYPSALQQANEASRSDDPYGDYYLRASIYDASGEANKAAETRANAHAAIMAALSKESPKSRAAFDEWSYPEVAFMSSDDDGAQAHEVISLLEPHVASGKLKATDLMLLGVSYCVAGRVPECKEKSRAAMLMSKKLDTGQNHHQLGEALKKAGDIRGAAEEFEQAYQRDPQNNTYRMDYETSGAT
jgi:tetratricopeptide (TPR) repeat protein